MASGATPGVPEGLIEAVVELVGTGPVPLGAYTLAEIAAVNGIIDFLEREPDPALLAEAVRSLAARTLITTAPDDEHVQVRGDLGIAIAFQERSRIVIDARVTGTDPDTPWRHLLMPQPEGVTLEVAIDALGIHVYVLRTSDDAVGRLRERLPRGDRGPREADLDAVLAASPATALVTVTRWQDDGARESTDVILARRDETLHVFLRDPAAPERFAAQGLDDEQTRALLARLAVP